MDHHIANQFGIDQTLFDKALKPSNWAYHTIIPRQQYINYKNTNQRCY